MWQRRREVANEADEEAADGECSLVEQLQAGQLRNIRDDYRKRCTRAPEPPLVIVVVTLPSLLGGYQKQSEYAQPNAYQAIFPSPQVRSGSVSPRVSFVSSLSCSSPDIFLSSSAALVDLTVTQPNDFQMNCCL